MYTTIRKNATKKIKSILDAAAIIRVFHYDDMGDRCETVTTAEVLDAIRRFDADRVYTDGESLTVAIHRNFTFTAYATKDAARSRLTAVAFAKYFPNG